MSKFFYIFIALVILILGFSISHWTNEPIGAKSPHNGSSKNCTSCHESSLSQEAWKGVPEWHTEEFCNPDLNSENREEHRFEAHNHRTECMNCHAANFQSKCANCHTQNEW